MTDNSACLVRAAYTAETITVYQAYGPQIADSAVRAGTFVPPFSRDRMTWIKPSFGWMMHRCGWAGKPGQERVLAIEISRAGFEWALARSCLSHYRPGLHASPDAWAAMKDSSPVRIQWDPDRSLAGERLGHRAVQVGLSGDAVHRYAGEWILSISDITARSPRDRATGSGGPGRRGRAEAASRAGVPAGPGPRGQDRSRSVQRGAKGRAAPPACVGPPPGASLAVPGRSRLAGP